MEGSEELTYEEANFINELERRILDENARGQVSIRSEAAKLGRSREWLDKQLTKRFQQNGNLEIYSNWKSKNKNKRK